MTSRAACLPLLCLLVLPASASGGESGDSRPSGTLRFRIVDASTGDPTPARVAVIDAAGLSHVAPEAVPVAGECTMPAVEGWADAPRGALPYAGLVDPSSGAKVFYADGPIEMELPVGRYRVSVSKGFEWEQRSLPVEVFAGKTPEIPIRISRWVDMPREGWVSADAHLHVSRPSRAHDPLVAAWMAAEDLQVANLLQMGVPGGIVGARQYAFGEEGRYQAAGVLLSPGQENPRTWILGHGMVLGASEYLDPGIRYLVYQPVWRKAREQGGVSGYAHWNPPGTLIDAPTGLVDLLEVLQVDTANYERLYELWDLGVRVTPVAGTDFPCIGDLPGAVRFYARVASPVTWERWLDAVRRGRTFVTNGPLLSLSVGSADVGDTLRLDGPQPVRVEASVRFDPTRDDVKALELVRDGRVVLRETEVSALGRIELSASIPIAESGWIALRSTGEKLDRRPYADRRRDSVAHTGSVVLRVADTPPLGTGARAARVAAEAEAEMRELEALFSAQQEEALLQRPVWQRGVDASELRASRPELLAEIAAARAWYASRR